MYLGKINGVVLAKLSSTVCTALLVQGTNTDLVRYLLSRNRLKSHWSQVKEISQDTDSNGAANKRDAKIEVLVQIGNLPPLKLI